MTVEAGEMPEGERASTLSEPPPAQTGTQPIPAAPPSQATAATAVPHSQRITSPQPGLGPVVPQSVASVPSSAESDPQAEGLPRRFGKYTLLRKLASGGMAELFLALQKSVAGFEKLVVIKRILPEMNQDRAFIDMLLHEARIAATLSHPNIVQIFDVGQVDGTYFIAMEHIHGEDIRSLVRQMKSAGYREFPLEHAVSIVLGMCAGLAYAHEKRDLDGSPLNIVHRDISPQNVVITFSGDVKVVDFGIAKSDHAQTETQSGRLKGKVPYMSPEQARGERLDARSDIFATGVILFELTTGKRLFKGASEYETLKLICDREYPLPSWVKPTYPAELERIVMKALSKNPAERFQSAREMQAALEEFVRHERIRVSTIALQHFMQELFQEKLAAQKEALLQGKQLADVIEARQPYSEPRLEADASRSTQALAMTSTPPTANTLTDVGKFKGRKRAAVMGGAIALLGAIVGVGAATMLPGEATQPKAAPATAAVVAAPKGTLDVTSNPPGAAIWINGNLRSEVTPAKISDLPLGSEIDVKITKEGFEPDRKPLVLTSDKPSLAVDSALKALPAPEVKPAIEPTPREVRSGTRPRIANARPQETVAVGTGKLNVAASGGWCNVSIDGVNRGATPIAGIELPAGPHKVVCTPDGKAPIAANVVVNANDTARYRFPIPQ